MMLSSVIHALLIALAVIVLAPLAVGLYQGLDRKLTAACQGRKGPPLAQPFYDMLKLLTKQRALASPWQSFFATLYLFASITALVLFYLGADLLMIFFISAAGAVCFVISAIAVPSPYGHIGAQRELLQVLAYEPLLFLVIVGFYLVTGSFMLDTIAAYPAPLLLTLPLMAIVLGYVLTIKLRKSPFDISACHHGHQEIVRGVQTEFAGRTLAVTELAHWYEIALVLSILMLFWATSLWGALLLLAAAFVLEIIVDNVCARTSWSFMLINSWITGLTLAVINILWLQVG